MTAPARQRIPAWVKTAYSCFVAILAPCYRATYTHWDFLYCCDLALRVTTAAVWIESPLLVRMQAGAIALPQLLWVIDLLCGSWRACT